MESYWYLVKVLPGKERILRDEYNKQIENNKIDNIVRFVCPTERELKIVKNKKQIREKVLYSGYLYFETNNILTEEQLKIVASLNGLMGLMGDKTPVRLRENDVKRIIKDDTLEDYNTIKYQYVIGEIVRVNDGPFTNFEGTISNLNGEKVSLDVKIFGRITPVELTLRQIEKL